MARLKPAGRLVVMALIIISILAAKLLWWDQRPQEAKASHAVGTVALPDAPEASLSTNAVKLDLPSSTPVANSGTKVDWKIMAWNAQFPLMYANGGPRTTKGSLLGQANLQVNLVRQDDCNKTIADLVKFAQEYKDDPNTTGVFASFMGDGMPAFFTALSKELAPLGSEYQPVAFYAMGKSYGEDQLMGPAAWRDNPSAALGKTVACVLRDGDMNILLKWAGDNGLKVNPDETSFDPGAINLVAANDFLDAANKYIANYRENRKKLVNGKKVSETVEVGVDAVATWTPADVNIAQQKGGLVTIASTKQYATQMPNVTITIRKFLNDHRTDMEKMIVALAQAGDQVRSFQEARSFAADVSAKVYNEQNGAYWLKYYNGVTERDRLGNEVALGGSASFNLRDAADMFGMGKDGIDRYKIVYTTFGDILSKMYPEFMKNYPSYNTIIDKSYLATVIANHPELMEGKAIEVQYAKEITQKVSSKSVQVQFETGSATIKSESYPVLDEILRSAIVAEGLKLGVYGHTDNVGAAGANQQLSESRARSVRQYLINKGMASKRIESKGYGAAQPIADNTTTEGKAKNRRVEIVLGN